MKKLLFLLTFSILLGCTERTQEHKELDSSDSIGERGQGPDYPIDTTKVINPLVEDLILLDSPTVGRAMDAKLVASQQTYELSYISYTYKIPIEVVRTTMLEEGKFGKYARSRKAIYEALRKKGYTLPH